MSKMTRCLMTVLVAASSSVAAFGAEAAQKQATGVDVAKWGHNAVVTSVLTAGQPFADLFSNALTLKDVVPKWVTNFNASNLPSGVNPEKVKKIQGALVILSKTVIEPPGPAIPENDYDGNIAQWTPYRIHFTKWNDLPGDTKKKADVHAAFKTLKDAGIMCLAFMKRNEPDSVPMEQLISYHAIMAVPKLRSLSHEALYTTPATYCDDYELEVLIDAMDMAGIIRTEIPDGLNIQPKTVGCCVKTTRTCNPSGSGTCNQCPAGSGICCLGSTWCP